MWATLVASHAAAAQESAARHAAHAGQHGGIALPVANDTLHIEGVWQEQRRFRVYVTDVAGNPLTPARLRALRIDVMDEAERIAPLVPVPDGQYLEARIATQPVPSLLTIVFRSPGADAERLGMLFSTYSVEPPSFEVPPTVIPKTAKEIVEALREQVKTALALVDAGAFGQVYEPTTHIRELLLALAEHRGDVARAGQREAEAAIEATLRASWLLHLSGDLGSPVQTGAAAIALRDAFDELLRTFRHLVTPFR